MLHCNSSSHFEGSPSEIFQKILQKIYSRFNEYGLSLKEKGFSLQIEICGPFVWTWDVSERKMSMCSLLSITNSFLGKGDVCIKETQTSFPFISLDLEEKEFIGKLMHTLLEKLLEGIDK